MTSPTLQVTRYSPAKILLKQKLGGQALHADSLSTRRVIKKYQGLSLSARSVLGISALLVIFLPLISLAALVPNCDTNCGWKDLVTLAKNLLDFMVTITIPIAAICFAWAGWLYLSARGNPGQITKAHGIFLNVAIGLVIVLVAWLVVDQIMKALVETGSYIPVLD